MYIFGQDLAWIIQRSEAPRRIDRPKRLRASLGLVDEIQSLLVQRGEGWSSLFGRRPGFERRGRAEVDAFKARVREVFAGWEVSALATVLECARRNGVEHVYVRASASVRGSSHSMRVTTARALRAAAAGVRVRARPPR